MPSLAYRILFFTALAVIAAGSLAIVWVIVGWEGVILTLVLFSATLAMILWARHRL